MPPVKGAPIGAGSLEAASAVNGRWHKQIIYQYMSGRIKSAIILKMDPDPAHVYVALYRLACYNFRATKKSNKE